MYSGDERQLDSREVQCDVVREFGESSHVEEQRNFWGLVSFCNQGCCDTSARTLSELVSLLPRRRKHTQTCHK